MRHSRRKLDCYAVQFETSMRSSHLRDFLKSATAASFDEDRVERLKRSECRVCFYLSGRIGGAAMTSTQCGICDKVTTYGNTNTDVLCTDCAKKHKLCRHCGADVELRPSRRDFKFLDEIKPTMQEAQ